MPIIVVPHIQDILATLFYQARQTKNSYVHISHIHAVEVKLFEELFTNYFEIQNLNIAHKSSIQRRLEQVVELEFVSTFVYITDHLRYL